MKGDAVDRDQLAILLGVSYDAASEILLAEIGDGLDVRHRFNAEGEDEWHLGDVQRIVERRRHDPRTFATRRSRKASSPARRTRPSRAGSMLFSDSGTPSGTVRVSASKLSNAAGRFGLTEQELTERLIGRAKMQVVDGELLIRNADLSRLVSQGTLPDPAQRKQVDDAVAEIEGRRAADPATEARSAAVADALGVDLGTGSKAKPGSGGGTVRVKADAEPRRLGRPRRWSERTW
jgi:hypothetical protein